MLAPSGTPCLCLVLMFVSSLAGASLGGTEASVEADRSALRGRAEVLPRIGYSVHEITIDGRMVREYALPDGTVFAVTWQGTAPPDLSVVLGRYFQEYSEAAARQQPTPRRRGGASVVRSRHMILERSGHMRDLRGKAYLPGLLPEGLRPEDIS